MRVMTGPDRTIPVPTPPHFITTCHRCSRALETSREPVYPGTEPWTYTCGDDRAAEHVDALPWGGREQWTPGELAYFEYHCWESEESNDADLWHRSHQVVTVLEESEHASDRNEYPTHADRADAGMPVVYGVRFADGHVGTAFEDELLVHPRWYERPDPPAAEGVKL